MAFSDDIVKLSNIEEGTIITYLSACGYTVLGKEAVDKLETLLIECLVSTKYMGTKGLNLKNNLEKLLK